MPKKQPTRPADVLATKGPQTSGAAANVNSATSARGTALEPHCTPGRVQRRRRFGASIPVLNPFAATIPAGFDALLNACPWLKEANGTGS